MMLSRALAIFGAFAAFASVSAESDYEASAPAVSTHIQASIRNGSAQCRGVNLGGWLVGERWMTSEASFWQGVNVSLGNSGEYTAITKAADPDDVRAKLEEHHSTFITEDDIRQIAAAGLNTVRVPVGFWIIGYDNHDPKNEREWEVYPKNTILHLDQLVREWAVKYNVAVMLSLHAAKGSQNGRDHSSPAHPGESNWSKFPENIANSIEVVTFLAARYLNDKAFLGIGLLNEPSDTTEEAKVLQYYLDAYKSVRATGSDALLCLQPMLTKQSPDVMFDFMTMPDYINICIEWHPYFIWGLEQKTDQQVVEEAVKRDYNARVTKWNSRPNHNRLFMGEWSFATANNMRQNNPDLFHQYGAEQVKIHNKAGAGWAKWTWKATGRNLDWSLKTLLESDPKIGEILRE